MPQPHVRQSKSFDAAGIPLLGEVGPSLHSYLQQQLQQLDLLSQAVSELMAGMHRLTPPTPPLPAPPLTVQPHASPPDLRHASILSWHASCTLASSRTCRAFMIQRLFSHALDWAAVTWQASGTIGTDYEAFIQELCDVFDHPDQGRSGKQKLLRLWQATHRWRSTTSTSPSWLPTAAGTSQPSSPASTRAFIPQGPSVGTGVQGHGHDRG